MSHSQHGCASEAKGPRRGAHFVGDHVVVATAHVRRARGLAVAVVGRGGVLEVGRARRDLEAARRLARRRLATCLGLGLELGLGMVRSRTRSRTIGTRR